jgi:phosphoribosylformimino-5-aminoimidazole carboxamide ribotide isomerase
MQLFPAIDLRGGKCVRLFQGDYGKETVYGDDPLAQARSFAAAGAPWIHIVDLDGARTGEAVNRAVIERIAGEVDVPLQVGGGIRSRESAHALFTVGVARVVIGTAALENPALVRELAATRRVAVGLDVRGREIAVRGWTEGSGRDLHEVAAELADAGVDALIVTQIARDGTLEGPDVEGLRALLDETAIPLIASGGVGNLEHLRILAAITAGSTGPERRLAGAIVGRALYDGRFTLIDALAAVQGTGSR